MTEATFSLPYPAAPFESGELATERTDDAAHCVCGNTADDRGFSTADHSGRYATAAVSAAPEARELAHIDDASITLSICNACGRVYADSTLNREEYNASPVLARIDLGSDAAQRARRAYLIVNYGDDALVA